MKTTNMTSILSRISSAILRTTTAIALVLSNSVPVMAAAPAANQLPTGGQVSAGVARIGQSGSTMTVTQSSQRASINWQTFNVGSNATVNFIQPSSSSVMLNRILDSNPSQIFGTINANGQVFFTNPSGMYFAPGASVDVGGLVATTHSISDADFMAANYNFIRNGATGRIVNDGYLTANLGGYIALLAPEVRNNGVIVAQMGTVALAAGEAYSLQFNGNNALTNIVVSPAAIQALVDNGNAVHAPGGLIILSAQAANSLQGAVVNNSGVVEATGLTNKNGVIRLASSGQTTISGTVDASNANGQGGSITVTGQNIQVDGTAHLSASGKIGGGTVLVGGSWENQDTTVSQATTVTVAPGAVIEASATDSGNGGTVVVRSDVSNVGSTAQVSGTLLATGGPNGGNGGKIETSGHVLDVTGISVKTGSAGQWLLDPADITISSSSDANYTNLSGTYTPNSGVSTSTINVTTLVSALNAGNNITVTTSNTGSAGAGTGNITVSNAISTTGASAGSLSLLAAGSIALNSSITLTGTGSALLVKAAGGITTGSSLTFQTNNANLIFWSNSTTSNCAACYIELGANNTLNTANGLTTQTTGGGGIWLAGGSGTTTPTGQAYSATANIGGVALGGTLSSSTNVTNIYSGGGNIVMNG